MQTLIEVTETLSPRAEWQREHGLVLSEYQHVHSLNRGGDRWVCSNTAQTQYASGDTPAAAEQAYCKRYGMDWWMWTGWDRAMGDDSVSAVLPDNPGEEMAFG